MTVASKRLVDEDHASLRIPNSIWWALVALLLASAVWVRWDSASVVIDGEIRIADADTVRRLVRLNAIDAAETYPIVETKDGYPDGTIHHWTLPMDWVIRALDPIGRVFWPNARKYEAGAVLAGPILAVLAILLMVTAVRRLISAAGALLVGLVYAFSYAFINATWFGNGDHQTLQHLLVLAAWLTGLLAIRERRSTWLPAISGCALGASVWVSTESQLMYYAAVAVVFALGCGSSGRELWARRATVLWSVAFLGFLVIGHVFENGNDFWAFAYDRVSWFQIWQASVFVAYALLAATLPWPDWRSCATAAACSLVVGLVPFASAAVRTGFAAERARFAKVNVWLQNEVFEFRGLFEGIDYSLSIDKALAQETWLIFALPIVFWGIWLFASWSRAARLALIALTVATFGLEVWEAKLGHFFAMTFPLALACGGLGIASRFASGLLAKPTWTTFAITGVIVGAATFSPQPVPLSKTPILQTVAYWRRLAGVLAEEAKKLPPGSVLAPWDMGAHIMYHADLPVLASNYHRNIDGILDAYRILLSTGSERDEAMRILRDRKVRLVVAYADQFFLYDGAMTIGREPVARHTPRGFVVDRAAGDTFYWQLREAQTVSGLRLARTGRMIPIRGREEPIHKVWVVR